MSKKKKKGMSTLSSGGRILVASPAIVLTMIGTRAGAPVLGVFAVVYLIVAEIFLRVTNK